MAKNLVYPDGCDSGLERYRLETDCMVEGCTTMSIYAVCSGVEILVKDSEEVLVNSFFSNEVDISFAAGTGTISPTGEFPLSNTADSYTVVVSIDNIGNISTEEYEEYP